MITIYIKTTYNYSAHLACNLSLFFQCRFYIWTNWIQMLLTWLLLTCPNIIHIWMDCTPNIYSTLWHNMTSQLFGQNPRVGSVWCWSSAELHNRSTQGGECIGLRGRLKSVFVKSQRNRALIAECSGLVWWQGVKGVGTEKGSFANSEPKQTKKIKKKKENERGNEEKTQQN